MKYLYDLRNTPDDNAIASFLERAFRIESDGVLADTIKCFDTFDWRLYNKNRVLFFDGKIWTLAAYEDGETIAELKWGRQGVFAWDFPESSLKESLTDILEMRALIQLFEAKHCTEKLRILNEDEKTIARLNYHEVWIDAGGTSQEPGVIRQIQLVPVRGYLAETSDVDEYLLQHNYPHSVDYWVHSALEMLGNTPGEYSSKLKVRITPEMSAAGSAREIMRFLLSVMKQNLPGIFADIDTEFIHDFRVAVRRTRSALSQLKKVFPEDDTQRFKADFAYVGKMTNHLRDLDVYLLSKPEFLAMLPDELKPGMTPFYSYLKRERKKALTAVFQEMQSEKFLTVLRDWESFLEKDLLAPNASIPVKKFADKRLHKTWRSFVDEGSVIDEQSPDEALHDLRVTGKKLRYLIEFFAGLYPVKEMNKMIKSLKSLQEHLGTFQDLCIQEDFLRAFVDRYSKKHPDAHQTMLAMGMLIGSFHTQKNTIKNNFPQYFHKFARDDKSQLFSGDN